MRLFSNNKTTRKSSSSHPQWQHPDLPGIHPPTTQPLQPRAEPRDEPHIRPLHSRNLLHRSSSVVDRGTVASLASDNSPVTTAAPPSATVFEASRGDRRSIAVGERDLAFLYGSNNNSSSHSQSFNIESVETAPQGPFYHAQTSPPFHRSYTSADNSPLDPPSWSPDYSQLPSPGDQSGGVYYADQHPMTAQHHSVASGRASTDSVNVDRWSQRRLQRQSTEQGFREQRVAPHGVVSSPSAPDSQHHHHYHHQHHHGQQPSQSSSSQQSALAMHAAADASPEVLGQPQPGVHHPPQPHQTAYQQPSRTGPEGATTNSGFVGQPTAVAHPVSNYSRAGSYSRETSSMPFAQQPSHSHHPPAHQHHQQHHQHPPADPALQYNPSPDPSRPALNARSQTQPLEDSSMSSNNNATLPAPKAVRSSVAANRTSVHNGLTSREGSHVGHHGVPAFSASVVPPDAQGQQPGAATRDAQGQPQPPSQQQQQSLGRGTPQPSISPEDMTEEDIVQLQKEYKELRDKYTKVKKYYFEKEDQVKQLQNSLAHQRLSQSRTSLDDSEYATRFNRLDGLIAQLAFSIRKNWKSLPQWLLGSVNKDAITTGKQEMTAAGRAFISCWLVSEVFNKYFHPDLEPNLSAQLKKIQLNMRQFAPPPHNAEEEEFLTSKIVNWRLATLEGLQEALRAPQCPEYRANLTDMLKDSLIKTLAERLEDPPPSDLPGGVHMIIELAVSIAIHLPLESRDVVIEYFMPGYTILQDQMKLESSGIPPLTTSMAEDQAERASTTSDPIDLAEMLNSEPPKKRGMLSAFTGSSKSKTPPSQAQQPSKGGSSSSLARPESSQGVNKEEAPPRVRMSAGIGVSIRGRSVLVKAPIFST